MSSISNYFTKPTDRWGSALAEMFMANTLCAQSFYVDLRNELGCTLIVPDDLGAFEVRSVDRDYESLTIRFTPISILNSSSTESKMLQQLCSNTTRLTGADAEKIRRAAYIARDNAPYSIDSEGCGYHQSEAVDDMVVRYVNCPLSGDLCVSLYHSGRGETVFGLFISDDDVYVYRFTEDSMNAFLQFTIKISSNAVSQPSVDINDLQQLARDYVARHNPANPVDEIMRLVQVAFRDKRELDGFSDLLKL